MDAATLVTGGSRGLGRAIVLRLAAEGRAVAFTWRSDEELAREVEAASSGRAHGYHLDLGDHAAPAALVAELERDLGPIDGLVNNAGERRDGLLALTSDADWSAVVDTSLGGAFRCCRAVLPGMVRRRRGAIVSISSLSALHGVAGHAAYAAAKAGILAMTRVLSREVGRRGIRVNAVLPGYVATDMTAGLDAAAVERLRVGESLPQGTQPSDVASVVAFLLSDGAAAVTGQSWNVDAGASA